MKLKNIRSLFILSLLVSLALIDVIKTQETENEDEFSTDPGTDESTGEDESTEATAAGKDTAVAAAIDEQRDEGGGSESDLTNLPSESADEQAEDKVAATKEEDAATTSKEETDVATDGAGSTEGTTGAGSTESGTEATETGTEATTGGETSAIKSTNDDEVTPTTQADTTIAGDFDTTSETSDYGFGSTHDDDHSTSDGTAEVAAETGSTSNLEDGTGTTAAADEGSTAGETGSSEPTQADGDMETTRDDEESSGDAQDGVTLGGDGDKDITPLCGEGEFQCDSKCLSSSKMCDGARDCADGRDESQCPGVDGSELSLQVTPNQETFTVRVGETLQFTCSARGPFPTIQVLVYKDQVPVDQSDAGSVQIRKDNLQASDGGQYICYAFPPDRSSYVVKSINVVVEGTGRPGLPGPAPGGAKTIDAKVDSNVVLECSLSTDENSNAKWKKLNGKLSEYIQEYYGKLYIYYLKLEDSGEYECASPDGRRDKVYLRVYDGDQPPAPERPEEPSVKYAIRAYVQEPIVRFRNGQTVEQECNAMTNGNNMEIEWYNQRQQLIRNDGKHTVSTQTVSESPLNKASKLTIKNVNQGDSGYYECRVRVEGQRENIRFELQPEGSGQVCAIEEATCRNGQCIPRSGLCDGRMDCSDGSDEVNCGGCEPNEKQCRNSKCIQKIWYCDGENDCGDNSDEDQCPEPKPGEICKTHEFLCRNGQQCVLKGFVCDGEYDCLDQSDESGCEKPSIVRGPIRNMTVYLGRTIRIECEASGFPAPYINWRLNWGHVCEEPRCVITNENGKGVLTISDARMEDAGAYSCEALNSKGRVFAVPDAIVYVLSDGEWKPIPTEQPYPTTRPRPQDPYDPYSTTRRPYEPYTYPQPQPTPRPQPPRPEYSGCDTYGSYTQQPPCQCKPNREGDRCDRCIERHFPLHVEGRNPYCAACFCNGLNVDCQTASLYYTKIESLFVDSDDGWRVDNKYANLSTSVDVKQDGIQFVEFGDFPGEDLFFYAPQKYLGNKLPSYGGNLTFSIRYEGPSSGRPKRIEVRIAGARVNIVHRVNRIFYPYYDYTVNIPIVQDEFRRFGDNGRVDREHMLMCLSDIQTIMIRASFLEPQYAVLLRHVSLDYAEPYPTSDSDKRSNAIESCQCPSGYSGPSCESCASGYKRAQSGSYLGQCEKSNDVSISIDLPNKRLELRPDENRVVYVNIVGPNDSNEQVRWSKDPDSYLPYGVTQQDSNLAFSNANQDMAGTYTATLYTPQGLVKETLHVIVGRGPQIQPTGPSGSRTPPSIYSPNQRSITLDIGEPFTLECVARGDPMPSIRIQPPEIQRQSADVKYAQPQQARPTTQPLARFEITYFTEDNAGTYTCIAENNLGEQAIERFVVSARRDERGPPTISVEPKRVEVFEGSSMSVNYTYTGAEPVQIKVEQYSSQPQSNSNIYVDRNAKKIDISRVSKDMQGQYVVEATNDYGTVSDYFEIVVNDAPGPKIMVTDTVIRTDVGTVLKIEPKVQYSGRPQFTWTKDGRPLPSNVQVLGYILYVPYVTKENQGVYMLTLVDDYGTAKIQVTIIVDDRLSVAPAPANPNRIIVKQDMDVELDAGQSANLVCQIQPRAYNPRIITTTSWVKGMREQRERFPSNIRPNQERLQILKIKPSDAGMYTCVTISSDGSTQTAVVNIRVRESDSSSSEQNGSQRPTVSQPPTARLNEREKQVRVGDTFELTCHVSGSPAPRVQWFYNGEPIEQALGNRIAVHAVPGRYTLTIRDAQVDLNGYVTCRATVGQDSAEDAAVVRSLPRDQGEEESHSSGEIRVRIEPRESNVRPSETVRLVCQAHGANPSELKYTWSKENGYLPGGSDGENADVLTLFNLQEQDTGVYTCTAENPSTGVSGRASSRVSVGESIINSGEGDEEQDRRPPPSPGQPLEPLKVEVQPKEATLVQGRSGEFVCNVQGGVTNKQVSWKRTGSDLDPERHRVQGNRLIISSADSSDRGYFECEVQSGEDIARDYTRVEVESREAPKIEIYPNEEQVELDLGGTVYAQCRVVAGIPTPTVEWRRTDRRSLSSRAVVTQEGSLLQISDATRDEMGSYECVAKNVEGEAVQKLNIIQRPGSGGSNHEETGTGVGSDENQQPYRPPPHHRPDEEQAEEKPPNVIIQTPVVQVSEGDTVTLKCQTSSAPPFRIDWSGPNGDYLGSTQDGTYSLPNARSSDSGTYRCTVTNRYGNSEATASVTIGDGSGSNNNGGGESNPYPDSQYPGGEAPNGGGSRLRVQVTPKSRTVTTGSQAEFTCDAQSSSGEPIIRWSRAGGLQLPEYHQTRGNQLILYNIEPEHAGRYQCTAQATDGSIEFDAAYLQVSRVDHNSPFPVYIRVREAPTDSYESLPSYRYGVRLTVECVAQTTDIDSIVWSKEEGVSRATYDSVSETEMTMVIAALLPMDLGNYVCIARRQNGDKAQNSIEFKRHPQHGNLFTYDITGPSGPVEEHPQRPYDPYNRPGSEHDNNNGSGEHGGDAEKQDNFNEPPQVQILGSKELTINEGGSAEIRCQVIGSNQVELSRHGEPLPANSQITKNGNVHILRLHNLRESDKGYYLCNAQNSHGPARDYLYLHVSKSDDSQQQNPQQPHQGGGSGDDDSNHDQQQPHQPDQSHQSSAKPLVSIRALTNGAPITSGRELRLACYVDDHEAQIEFARVDSQVDETRARVESSAPGVRELVVDQFDASDAGSYRCTARNRHGVAHDVGHVEAEADNSFTFKTDIEVSPGNPHVTIRPRSVPHERSPLDVECRLEEENGIPANSFSWAKYPSLPRTSRVEHNQLRIEQFEHDDNGLYTCRASTDENDYERSKLIASNDYLLGSNPYFRLTKVDDGIEVKCRPESDHSTFTWRASSDASSSNTDDSSYTIDGDRLIVYPSAAGRTFACHLNTDSEFGPISIELDVTQELIDRALNNNRADASNGGTSEDEEHEGGGADNEAPARLYVDESRGHGDGPNSYLECQPDRPVKSIRWERTDGRRMSPNMVAYSSRLIYNRDHLNGDDYGNYTCVVEMYSGRLVRKQHLLHQQDDVVVVDDYIRRPIVRIIPVVKDMREGGRIELECKTGYDQQIKWYKNNRGEHRHELATSNMLAINYLQLDDAGRYECEATDVRSRSVIGRDVFELILSTFTPKYDDESREGDARVRSEHEVNFLFIEKDVRPFGQVVVLCESNLHDATNTWHKIDESKPSQHRINDDRLTISRMNKYDLENYECRSRYENSVLTKRLELNADEYKKEMNAFFATSRNLEIVLVRDLSDLRVGGKITLKCTNEEIYEKKVWLDDNFDVNRVKKFNDLLQIEPLEKSDYGVYSCLFIDEYGEKKIHFKIDEKLLANDDVAYLMDARYGSSSTSFPDSGGKVSRLDDVIIDVMAVTNFKNRIKIKCRNQFDKTRLVLEKIEKYDNEFEIDSRQGQILFESLEDQYETDQIVDDLSQLPVVYKCLSKVDAHLKGKSKFLFTNVSDGHLKSFSIRYLNIYTNTKPVLLYEYDTNNREGILYEIRYDVNLDPNDIEWLDAKNNIISTGSKLMRYQVSRDEKSAIKLRIYLTLNDTQFELKLTPSKFLDTYDEHWSSSASASSSRHYHHHVGHYKQNTSSTWLDHKAVHIEVSGGFDVGYLKFACEAENGVEFEWLRRDGGSLLDTNAKVANKSNELEIRPLESKDIDVYMCIVRNSTGTQTNGSVALDNEFRVRRVYDATVTRKPEIIEIYKYGERMNNREYSLKCISDVESAMIEWWFNGMKLKTGMELTFDYLSKENEGVYECQAHNAYGSAKRAIEISLVEQQDIIFTSSTSSKSTKQQQQNHHINIQVLSNPQVDHIENGRVQIKCISDIVNAVYVWTLVNRTEFSRDTRVDPDGTLTLEPFTRDSAGVYRCLAYNIERNEQASRRININIESSQTSGGNLEAATATTENTPKQIFVDITHKMRIDMISSPSEMKRGGTVRLKCSVDEPNAGVVWTKRGSKFSNRASGSATESLHTAILTIKNFQSDDLGVYICKAKSLIDIPSKNQQHKINIPESSRTEVALKGELLYYLMSSQFGFATHEQLLLGPDVHIEAANCGAMLDASQPTCRLGESVLIKCETKNYDTGFPELKVDHIEWRRVDSTELPSSSSSLSSDIEIIKDGRTHGRKSEATMKIEVLDETSIGMYACYVHASTGTIRHLAEIQKVNETNEFRVNVPKRTKKISLVIEKTKPFATINKFNQKTELNFGETYYFDCVSDGNKLEWLKLEKNATYPNRFKVQGQRLRIEDYKPSLDSGVYACIASKAGKISNASIYLGDTGRLNIKISKLPLDFTGDEYDVEDSERVIELTCQISPHTSETAKAKHRIVWRRLDKEGSALSSHIRSIESKHLQIRNFSANDDNGVYACSLYSVPDNTLIDETQIELNLPSLYTARYKRLDVHVTVENRYNLDYGSNLKMSCHSPKLTNHDYSLEWIRLNDLMPNNSNVNENSLTLFNVSKDNLGEYVCLITNKAGQAQASVKLVDKEDRLHIITEQKGTKKTSLPNVTSLIDDKLKLLLGSMCFQVGQPIAIECYTAADAFQSSDNENFIPSWRKMYNSDSISNSPSPNILYINEFKTKDLGVYLCRTKNVAGVVVEVGVEFKLDTKNSTLIVVSSMEESSTGEQKDLEEDKTGLESEEKDAVLPNIRITFSDKLALARGERVELVCDSDSGAKVEWYKVASNDPHTLVEYLTDSASLVRSPVTNDDLGRYRCVATAPHTGRTRARDAVLSKIDDDNLVDLLIYGFVDRQTTEVYVDLEQAAELKQLFRTSATATSVGTGKQKAPRSDWADFKKINGLHLYVKRIRPRLETRKLKLGKPAAFKCLSNYGQNVSTHWLIPRSQSSAHLALANSSTLSFKPLIKSHLNASFQCIGRVNSTVTRLIYSISREPLTKLITTRTSAYILESNAQQPHFPHLRIDFRTPIESIRLGDPVEYECSSRTLHAKVTWLLDKRSLGSSSVLKSDNFTRDDTLYRYKCLVIDLAQMRQNLVSVRFREKTSVSTANSSLYEALIEPLDAIDMMESFYNRNSSKIGNDDELINGVDEIDEEDGSNNSNDKFVRVELIGSGHSDLIKINGSFGLKCSLLLPEVVKNEYTITEWLKDDILIENTTNSDILAIQSVQTSDLGEYKCRLRSNENLKLVYESIPVILAISGDSLEFLNNHTHSTSNVTITPSSLKNSSKLAEIFEISTMNENGLNSTTLPTNRFEQVAKSFFTTLTPSIDDVEDNNIDSSISSMNLTNKTELFVNNIKLDVRNSDSTRIKENENNNNDNDEMFEDEDKQDDEETREGQSVILAKLKDPVVLKCPDLDASKRTSSVKWFRSGVELSDSTLERLHSKDLFFRNVKEEDFGRYGCSLSTDSESVSSTNKSRIYYILLEKAETVPYFDKKSLLGFNLTSLFNSDSLSIELSFKSNEPNGVLMYIPGKSEHNYIMLVIENSYLIYKSNIDGSYEVRIKPDDGIDIEKWNHVKLIYYNDEITLNLNSKEYKTVAHLELSKLRPLVYLGGTANYPHSSFMRGLTGAISELVVNDRTRIELEWDARLVKRLNVLYSSTCSSSLCNHKGACVRAQNRLGYKCLCDDEQSGANCEKFIDDEGNDNGTILDGLDCLTCLNGGNCSTTRRACDCPLGFSGRQCSKHENIKHSVEFKSTGYIELNSTEFYREFRSSDDREHFFAISFSTRQKHGLIMRQEDIKRPFDIEIIIQDGFLVYRSSNTITVVIDNLNRLSGDLSNDESKLYPRNTKIYIGGYPKSTLEQQHFLHPSFRGIIYSLKVKNKPNRASLIDFRRQSVAGFNAFKPSRKRQKRLKHS